MTPNYGWRRAVADDVWRAIASLGALAARSTAAAPASVLAVLMPKTGLDLVDHPPHYTAHPSGVECIQITEQMGFNLGNAVKYIWRADEKGSAIEDLRKAAWYVQREIERRSCS